MIAVKDSSKVVRPINDIRSVYVLKVGGTVGTLD